MMPKNDIVAKVLALLDNQDDFESRKLLNNSHLLSEKNLLGTLS